MTGRVAELGLISDTHGLQRPEAPTALRRGEQIIHAGDVGPQEILDELAALAPVTVVRGNTDHGAGAASWPETAVTRFADRNFYVIHDLAALDLDPAAAGLDVVVYGHSHRPAAEVRAGVLYLNPGSAGPRRFALPVTLARARAGTTGLELSEVDLQTGTITAWRTLG